MTIAQITAVLRAIEDRLSDPTGQQQQSYHDILRIYGLVAQIAEVSTQQRDQIQAMTEAIAMLHGRVIEHERYAIARGALLQSLYVMVEALMVAQGNNIAQQAIDARKLIQAAAAAQLDELEQHAASARELIRSARIDVRDVIQQAAEEPQQVDDAER